MINVLKFLPLLLLLDVLEGSLFAQQKNDLTPKIVIDTFISKIGGDKWLTLKSRKEYAFVESEEDKNSILPSKSYERIRIFLCPGMFIDAHRYSEYQQTIFVFKPECNWYYSSRSQVIKFFGPEPIEFKNAFPRTELTEVLNLEAMKKVYIEDTLCRVDFKDIRQQDGKQSLFFGINSGLLYKRSYTSKNDVHWEYHFGIYKESQGFYEPHRITLTSNGEDYLTISVNSIVYNNEVDPNVFAPPVPCKNVDDFSHLEFPFELVLD